MLAGEGDYWWVKQNLSITKKLQGAVKCNNSLLNERSGSRAKVCRIKSFIQIVYCICRSTNISKSKSVIEKWLESFMQVSNLHSTSKRCNLIDMINLSQNFSGISIQLNYFREQKRLSKERKLLFAEQTLDYKSQLVMSLTKFLARKFKMLTQLQIQSSHFNVIISNSRIIPNP